MRLFLAGVAPWRSGGGYDPIIREYHPYILESFYYADKDTERLLPYYGDFLLDSGAFTFLHNFNETVDWQDYVERYADFINRNKVEKFFELDIDPVIGYENVLKIRKRLEQLTGKQCIPVWHLSRGIGEFTKMCDEYQYVALGGIVSEQRHGKKYKQYHSSFPWFINTAHKKGAKIHGLGFTSLTRLKDCHFDSVDSTAWTTGNRFGYVWQFDGKTMKKVETPKNHRITNPKAAALYNYMEWIKFQRWAKTNL